MVLEPRTCIEAEPYALRVTDDSMSPEFQEGCLIIVDPTGVARDGAFVLAELENGYLLRRLRFSGGITRLEPLNPDYAAVELNDGLSSIRGVVVQRAGTRRRYHKRYD